MTAAIVRTKEEIAATIAKLTAEALAATSLATKNEAEARKFLAEADGGAENVGAYRAQRLNLELAVRTAQRAEEELLSQAKYQHVYHYTDAVDGGSSRRCMAQIDVWHHSDPTCTFEICFSSPGGSVIDGMALFDYILQMRAAGHVVITSTIGMAASMAGILLQAGDLRRMGRESYLLIHEVSFGAGGKIGEVEDEVKFVKKIQERVLKIFADRSRLSVAQLKTRWERKDWWLDSDEALRLGLIDEVA